MSEQEFQEYLIMQMLTIQKVYKSAHPNGDYLNIKIDNETVMANNRHWDEDSNFKICFVETFNGKHRRKKWTLKTVSIGC